MRAFGYRRLAGLAQIRGRLEEATRHRDAATQVDAQRLRLGREERDLLTALHRAERAAWFGSDPGRAGAELERLWQQNQRLVAGRPPIGRRYQVFIQALAAVGRPAPARRLLEEFRASFPESGPGQFVPLLRMLEAEVLLAEARPLDAVLSYRTAIGLMGCDACLAARIGRAYDRAGALDSALAYYRRYVETPPAPFGPTDVPILDDERWLAPTYRRLGELYEQRGDRAPALDYYGRFVELWKDADPELQPVVRDVRQRMVALAGEGGRR
jgi:tetratricopeptide (TPR) repeat protein